MNLRIYLKLISLIVALVIFVPPFSQGGQTCATCGKGITSGKYIEIDGKYYHPNHFLCGRCKKSIGTGTYYKIEHKYICQTCFERYYQPSCGYCRRPIEGTYIDSDGKKYHKDCYQDHIAQRCRICGKVLKGAYFKDYWGNNYCEHHRQELNPCEYCGRLITKRLTGSGQTYADGRNVCGYCLKSAVNSERVAWHYLRESLKVLNRLGIEISEKNINLKLVDRNTLGRAMGNETGRHTGFVKYEGKGMFGKVISQKYDIFILNGMPTMDYLTAISHELMHVWHYSQNILENDPAWSEGSCNYAAFLVLNRYSDEQAAYIIAGMNNDPNPVYGEGFRRVKKLVEAKGISSWLESVRKSNSFPLGY